MNAKLGMALASFSFLLAPALSANDDISLGEPVHGGTGCPQGSVTSVLSDDAKTLSVLFDAYVAETRGGDSLDRASCGLAVPLHVPQGYSVALVAVDYRGFADIPGGAVGRFSTEYFFAGERGPKRNRTFSSGYTNDFLVEDDVNVTSLVWAGCGEDVILRSNSSILVEKNRPYGPNGYMAIDSADAEAGLQFHLRWKRCS